MDIKERTIIEKQLRELPRRKVRNLVFQVRHNRIRQPDLAEILKITLQPQLKDGLTWDNFTFQWDLGAEDPLQVVTPYTWIESGGKTHRVNVDALTKRMFCEPTAFTQQEM